MATYEEIYGKRVDVLDADPTLTSATEGQVWYNSTSGTLKSVVAFESVAAGSNLGTARNGVAGAGSQTAALAFGGDVSPPVTNLNEEYNGTGWAVGGALNTARKDLGSAGTQTAGLGAGGYNSGAKNESEEYNGSSWAEGDNLNNARYRLVGCGTQTAAMVMGGRGTPEPQPVVATVEDYNGTSWTTGTSLNTARQAGGGAGTTTAGLLCGGGATPPSAGTTNTANSEEWDGTSWSEGNNMPSAKRAFAGQNGIQTAAIMMGGAPNATIIQTYDGTSWATSPATLVTQRHNGSGTINQPGTTGMAVAGSADPGPTASTEEYNKSINTFTAAAWASGGALGTPRGYQAGSGTQTAAVCFNGYNPGGVQNAVENYNGSTWSEQGTQNTARNQAAGVGLQTASLVFGGQGVPSPAQYAVCETYDGSSFTEVGNLNTARRALGGAGTQTAALGFLGNASGPADTTSSESWNGSAWTATPSANTARTLVMGAFGTSTAAVAVGGNKPPGGAQSNDVEEWDGSSWTSVSNLPYSGNAQGGSGVLTAGIIFGGNDGSALTTTLGYDGTNWSTRPALSTARQGGGPARNGTSELTLFAGGSPYTTATEVFTGVTETVTARTLTTS